MNSRYGLKKHQCDRCTFASSRKSNLQRHYNRRHDFDNVTGVDQLKAHHHQQVLQTQQAPLHDQDHQNRTGDGVGKFLDKQAINIQNDVQTFTKKCDIRLKENFKIFISGPSRCGKTFFVSDLLENIEEFSKRPPQTIIYIYTVWQTKFDEMRSVVDVFIQDNENMINQIQNSVRGQPAFVIFDDLINSNSIHFIWVFQSKR